MELIATKSIPTDGTNSVTFSSIPQTYTDLIIKISARASTGTQSAPTLMSINGNTSNLTFKRIQGAGSGAVISQSGSGTGGVGGIFTTGSDFTANVFGSGEVYIPNYTSANYKSYSIDSTNENNGTGSYMSMVAGLWSDTAAITSLTFTQEDGNTANGSTFYLYGISNVTSGSKATGGIVSSDGTYWYHMFPYSGTFTPTEAISADVLCIAGGAAGGYLYAGGGGAGGVSYQTGRSITTGAKTVTVGAGGAGVASGSNAQNGQSGSNSVFDTITSNGGGGGAAWISSTGTNGVAGGSGGGGSMGTSSGNTTSGGAANQGSSGGATGYGNAGGGGYRGSGSVYFGGGGGGAGAAGTAAVSGQGGAGGAGLNTWSAWAIATQTGVNGYYAGGGGGGAEGAGTAPAGGAGGGGTGNLFLSSNATSGTINTGSGGGGNANASATGSGGSGIVIIRYAI